MIEAIVFDMDGLLVDSEGVWNEARRRLAAEVGREWTSADHQAVMGVSTQAWCDYMIRRLDLALSPRELQDRIVGNMLDVYAGGVPYMPGAIEAVDLAAQRYPVAVASGSHRRLLDALTADAALAGKFRAIVCSDEVPNGKPAPDVYLEAARRLHVAPGNCLCLEDSASGIRSGLAAGMTVIAVPDPRYAPPDAVLRQAHLVLPNLRQFTLDTINRLPLA